MAARDRRAAARRCAELRVRLVEQFEQLWLLLRRGRGCDTPGGARDLLAGRVPPGFDPGGAALTARVLAVKRAGSAARALGALKTLAGRPGGFVEYAAAHPKADCSAHDARDYIAWLRAHGTESARVPSAVHAAASVLRYNKRYRGLVAARW